MSKLKQCKVCSKEIASNAKLCPECGAKNSKPFYKKVWFWVICAIIIIIASMGGESSDNSNLDTENKQEISQNENIEETSNVNEVDKNIPTEYRSALKKAKLYSETMHMSKDALYDQLTSEYGEQFTEEAAQYAIDNVEANWNENALKKAKSYSDTMYLSKSGVYDQLVSENGEKFTKEEAQYAIDNVEANWNENALKKAKTYQESMSMSTSAIYDQLVSNYGEKFTKEEAQYAIDNLE